MEKEVSMEIQAMGKRTVSVRLSGRELEGYGLTFSGLESGNRRMERMMREILSRVWEETGLELFGSPLKVRAVPQGEGCRLILTGLKRRKLRRVPQPAAGDFLQWEDLCREAGDLLQEGCAGKSSVYRMPEGWRILLWGEDLRCRERFGARYAGRGVLFEAAAVEFGELLCRDRALEWLAGQNRREEMAAAGSSAPKT